jgi:DNA-binding NarL/FixJ family response regulator
MLFLRSYPNVKVTEVASLSNLQTLILKNGTPTLFTMDPTLPELRGLDGLRKIKALFPDTPLLVYSSIPAEEAETICRQAGADFFIEKTSPTSIITTFIKNHHHSNDDNCCEYSNQFDFSKIKLTLRQTQLLNLLDIGLSNDAIGTSLDISPHTVKVHLWRLYKKFNVKSRTQLLCFARENGLI